jgi:hypothetical protein
MKGERHLLDEKINMNKQKTRYTPFSGEYRMPVNLFCKKYGINLRLIMHRMNVLYWEDFDSLVIPQELGDTSADKIRRTLQLLNMGWKKESIAKGCQKIYFRRYGIGVSRTFVFCILLRYEFRLDFNELSKN